MTPVEGELLVLGPGPAVVRAGAPAGDEAGGGEAEDDAGGGAAWRVLLRFPMLACASVPRPGVSRRLGQRREPQQPPVVGVGQRQDRAVGGDRDVADAARRR